jgi:hypothetical protein
MPYLLTHFWPGATEEHYRAEVAAVHPSATTLPAGQLHHYAGRAEGGILITALWDSKESCDRFVQEVLLPAQPVEGGFPNPVVEYAAELINDVVA